MDIELHSPLKGAKLNIWQEFLSEAGLAAGEPAEQTALVWADNRIIATGSRQGNVLKCLAVSPAYQGEGLLGKVLTVLRQEAFRCGHHHLFLYTKPQNAYLFAPLLFYPVAQTKDVLLMEDRKDGIREFLSANAPQPIIHESGAVVMNCDPFTLGHRYLIETAASKCPHLYVFVLSEDQGHFTANDRLEMVRRGTAHLNNVTVLPTGPYLISNATFPTYFLKNRDAAEQIHCQLDVEIFTKYFAPAFGVAHRFVGTEPLSALTCTYNQVLQEALPQKGISVTELPRFCIHNQPVSASAVRAALAAQDWETIRSLVPASTLAYLKENLNCKE